jgi:hypothetical protein
VLLLSSPKKGRYRPQSQTLVDPKRRNRGTARTSNSSQHNPPLEQKLKRIVPPTFNVSLKGSFNASKRPKKKAHFYSK